MTFTCASLKVEPNHALPKDRSSARTGNAEGAASEGYRIGMTLRQLADPRPLTLEAIEGTGWPVA
jgi:hypothetical protein